jgi:DNA-binding NtrC family response regulator
MIVEAHIAALAKSMTPMRLRQAQYVFDALYLRAALTRSSGNVTKAAEIAGMNREGITRIINRTNGAKET